MPGHKLFHIVLFIIAFTYLMACPTASASPGCPSFCNGIDKKIAHNHGQDTLRLISVTAAKLCQDEWRVLSNLPQALPVCWMQLPPRTVPLLLTIELRL